MFERMECRTKTPQQIHTYPPSPKKKQGNKTEKQKEEEQFEEAPKEEPEGEKQQEQQGEGKDKEQQRGTTTRRRTLKKDQKNKRRAYFCSRYQSCSPPLRFISSPLHYFSASPPCCPLLPFRKHAIFLL